MPRTRARYLAPVALAAVVVAMVLVIQGSAGKSRATGSGRPPAAHSHRRLRHSYRVRAGDSLSQISVRTGVSVDRLEQLNPRLDPNALRPGQRLKLR